VIYTFFELKIQNNGQPHNLEVHENLLAVWTKLWQEAGWEPRVLTLDDSKKHPDYEKYRDAINTGNAVENTFDYMCFMRWLAMASHGEGGWMSDYDTFPMGMSHFNGLPNGGVFTGWERHVPSLLSGSAEEWDRMSRMVLDMAVTKYRDEGIEFYSDMYALFDIIQNNEHEFIREMTVYMGYPYKEAHVVDCNALENIMVVHLSHARTDRAVESGLVESPIGRYDESIRPYLATSLNEDWKEQCITKSNESDRPKIYTFFQVKLQNNGKLHDTSVHENLLAVWTKLWHEAGWEPKILTLDDARKHPDYEKYRDAINTGNAVENTYDYMCFMRWLAMASHGEGGWMSDYDTFPMGISHLEGLTLPNGGTFTGWERHVPSLLSGSAEEWDRISRMVLDMAVTKYRDEGIEFYSDMFALHDVVVNNENEIIRDIKVYKGFPYKEAHVVDCDALKNMKVVHLSHARTHGAVDSGLVESPIGKYDESIRPFLASVLSADWKEQCIQDAFSRN